METRQHTTEKKNQWVNNKNEIKEEILKYHCHFKKNDNENTHKNIYGMQQKQFLEGSL